MKDFMDVRIAKSAQELDRIFRLRYSVYIAEMREPLRADHQHRILTDESDSGAVHFYTERAGAVNGVARLHIGNIPHELNDPLALDKFGTRKKQKLAYVSRLIVDRSSRCTTTTAALMCSVYSYARARGVEFGFLHCYSRLVSLYKRLGFVSYVPAFEAPQGLQTPLVIAMSDVDHLRRVKSIFLPAAERFPYEPEPVSWFQRMLAQQRAVEVPERMVA